MKPELLSALTVVLAAIVSAFVSYFVHRITVKAEERRLERGLQRRLTEKLYDLRLDAYRKAFELTLPLKGITVTKRKITRSGLIPVLESLEHWYSTDAALLLTAKTYNTYHALRKVLEKVDGSGIEIQQNDLQEIAEARLKFRLSLREDLKLLYGEEEQPDKDS